MIESKLATEWAALSDFPNQVVSWTWFKESVSGCLTLIAQRLDVRCELRSSDLADAFFNWVGYTDSSQNLSKLDPVDYAHYACGILLTSFVQSKPISVIEKNVPGYGGEQPLRDLMRWPEDLILLCLTLTILESWRLHLGTEPLRIDTDLIERHWDSFHENSRDDTYSPIAFLDLFLGLPPVWENPITAVIRPAMRVASERRNAGQEQQI